MKKLTKNILIFCAATFCIGIIFSIIGVGLNGTKLYSKAKAKDFFKTIDYILNDNKDKKYNKNVNSKTENNNINLQSGKNIIDPFTSFNIQLNYCDINIKSSNDNNYYIEYEFDKDYYKDISPSCYVEDKHLSLEFDVPEYSKYFSFVQDVEDCEAKINLYIPKISISEAEIVSEIGDIEISDIDFNYLNIITDESDINIKNCNIEEKYIQNNYGDISMKNSVIDNSDLDIEEGDINLQDSDMSGLLLKNYYGDIFIKDCKINDVNLIIEEGDIDLQGSTISNFSMENDYGDISMKNSTIDSLNFNCEESDINGNEMYINNISINAEYSDINLSLLGNEKDYGYNLYSEYGNIKINNSKVGENYSTINDYNRYNKYIYISIVEEGDIKLNVK